LIKTATVAEWLTLPAEPEDVPVIVAFPGIGGGLEEQPAKAMRSTTAVASPRRTRTSLVFGTRKSNSAARIRGTICHMEIGGVCTGGGGTAMPLVLVIVTATDCGVFPSAGVTGVATVQVVPEGPVQVNATL
jgi:hypothetical protein